MRNLLEHPITTSEILDFLNHSIAVETVKCLDSDGPIGDETVEILDEIVRRIRTIQDWYVSREDQIGNPFMIRGGLSEHDARALHALFEKRGHKQTYFVKQEERNTKVA